MPHNTMLRIRAEYLEMPGMRLTFEQAQRFCGVERALCQAVLDALVNERFLCLKSDGHYARLTEGDVLADVLVRNRRKQTSQPNGTP